MITVKGKMLLKDEKETQQTKATIIIKKKSQLKQHHPLPQSNLKFRAAKKGPFFSKIDDTACETDSTCGTNTWR